MRIIVKIWIAHDMSVVIDSLTYTASTGLSVTAAKSTADLRVDTVDVTAFLDVSTEDELLSGIWDQAMITNFWYNWADPPAAIGSDTIVVRHGTLGEVTRTQGLFTATVPGLMQRLNVRVGRAYSPGCPWRHAIWNGTTYESSVECGLALGAFIISGSATSPLVDPFGDRYLNDSANAQVIGYFNEGLLTFTSGNNAGITREVSVWDPPTFAFKRPFPYLPQVGDTYLAVKGDSKRFDVCQAYNNEPNFGGFPHIPGFNKVYSNVVEL